MRPWHTVGPGWALWVAEGLGALPLLTPLGPASSLAPRQVPYSRAACGFAVEGHGWHRLLPGHRGLRHQSGYGPDPGQQARL